MKLPFSARTCACALAICFAAQTSTRAAGSTAYDTTGDGSVASFPAANGHAGSSGSTAQSGTPATPYPAGGMILYAIPGQTIGSGTITYYGDYVPNTSGNTNGHDDTAAINQALAPGNVCLYIEATGSIGGFTATQIQLNSGDSLIGVGTIVARQRDNSNEPFIVNCHPYFTNVSGSTNFSVAQLPGLTCQTGTTQTLTDSGIQLANLIFDSNASRQAAASVPYVYCLGPSNTKTIGGYTRTVHAGIISTLLFQGVSQSRITDCTFVNGFGFELQLGNCDHVTFQGDTVTETNPAFSPSIPGLTAALTGQGYGDGWHLTGNVTNTTVTDCQRLWQSSGSPIDFEDGPGDGNGVSSGQLDGDYIVCRSFGPNAYNKWIQCYSNGGGFGLLGETGAGLSGTNFMLSGTTVYNSSNPYVPALSSPVQHSLIKDCVIGPAIPMPQIRVIRM